ncbi:toprim domain-containing protein [Devosia sp. BSSL-BM10]|uniref:Toprim domain-containing protein n=1 Tax=Devosia litorisediminis TaxID=2829817 RepID=A0A942ED22_9HYPH|nr:CHC2 zinc finger domain-containing protein [Devosia litorisediminis]MBS3850214.1 toprim domain-containing protein [Devosia litorisediminis]
MARRPSNGSTDVAKLVEQANIVTVAERLGLHVDKRIRQPRRALCPFHDDKDPSLNLYRGGGGRTERDHYHCFVCGAHGDAVALIQNYEKVTFWEAIQRLAAIEGVELDSRRRPVVDRSTGASVLTHRLSELSKTDEKFVAFSKERGFDPTFLRGAGAGNTSLAGLIERARADRTIEEQLVEAGVLRRDDAAEPVADLYGPKLRGFFGGNRIVFPIDGPHDETVGFAARALDQQKPKYLYSYNFPRSTSLYGQSRLIKAVEELGRNGRGGAIDIYLVEGIFDVLRLEQLGFHALGVLGAQITPGQIERIARIQELVGEFDGELRIHIFFDWDDAGKRGAYDATLQLLGLLQHGHPFELTIIASSATDTTKVDPDTFLRGLSFEDAQDRIRSASAGPLEFLAAYRLGTDPSRLDWSSINRLRLASIARSVAISLHHADWSRIIAPLPIDDQNLGLAQFAALVRSYGGAPASPAEVQRVLQPLRDPADDRSDLLTALTLGRSSTSRREYPLDDDAWERLAIAASPLFHIHSERLAAIDGPSSPLLARHVPKGGGKYRLKSGPVAHDAILLQYALVELLRDRDDCPSFADSIPAIRYSRDGGLDGGIYKTGRGFKQPALSFAYQIDMAIVNGLSPPRREGIFRPYFECWRAFVDCLDDRIKHFRHDEMQIVRLDITGFYDHIRSDVFTDALTQPLERALHSLNFVDGDIGSFAPLLAPSETDDAAGRSEIFTRFLLQHSFGLRYFDPLSGKVVSGDAKSGIPQGPDLSAYLANISLFDLDDMMGAEVSKLNEQDTLPEEVGTSDRCSAAYARYVDDVVIICRDFETAAQLRRKIETFISHKGLSLNRKNVTPPPMSRAEARGWITDNRAGFGFSGPLADLPTTEAMDPLADAGEIDRRTALGLLFDRELDNPANAEGGLAKIGIALGAADIRFNDRANAYRRLWCFAADKLAEPSGDDLAASFIRFLTDAEPRALHLISDSDLLDIAMAAMEGLDRALRFAVLPGTFGQELCDRIDRNLKALSASVLDDPFTSLQTLLLGSDKGELLSRFDTRCQIGIIACLASENLGVRNNDFQFSFLHKFLLPGTSSGEALPEGLLHALLKHDAAFARPLPSLIVASGQSSKAVFSRLNQTLVELQRAQAYGAEEGPSVFSFSDLEEPNKVVSVSQTIMSIWAPSIDTEGGTTLPTDVEFDAAATLVNLTYSVFAEIALRRPRLTRLIAGVPDAIPLPSPPGLRASGILLWCPDGRLLLASAGTAEGSPLGVKWRDSSEQLVPGIAMQEATLPAGSRLLVEKTRKWSPSEIAGLYRAGFNRFDEQINLDAERVPVPTAFSFFGKIEDGVIDFSSVLLISWPALRSSVDGHAFVRVGPSLEARSVYAEGADLWRYGWAVRDACNRAEPSQDDDAGMDAQAATALDEEFHRREAIVARVLPRLSGADQWGPGEGTPGNPIPTRIRRALSLLENFELASTAAQAASYLVAAVSEGMFMSERVNALHDLKSNGNPAELLARATKRVGRALPEASKHWDITVPPSLPYRRSASAWQTLSVAIGQANGNLPGESAAPLNALEAGAETLAAIADLRALAFEIAASLPEASLERLIGADFDLAWVSDAVGLDLIMINDRFATLDPSLIVQTSKVVHAFCQVVLGKRGGLNFVRDQITPAGWVVLIAILIQVVPVRQRSDFGRPSLWQTHAGMIEAEAALQGLLRYFASSSTTTENAPNWPWDVFDQLLERRPADLPLLLRQLTDATAIEVSNEVSWSAPRTADSQGGRPIMRLADGSSISLADWQIDVSYVVGERGAAMETYPSGNRLRFPYSISRRGDQVLGFHLVSRKLGEAAFGRSFQIVSIPTKNHDDQVVKSDPPAEVSIEQAKPDSVVETLSEEATVSSAASNSTVLDEALALIDKKRLSSWEARSSAKNPGTHRVALVQWDVVDSYYSPGHKGGQYEGLVSPEGDKPAGQTKVKDGGVFLSTSEYRRRTLIREVLKACADLKVDGLVFPEYSLRPETINWLARQLKTQPQKITVWCGTFRVPSGTQLDQDFSAKAAVPFVSSSGPLPTLMNRWDAHTAVLTCLRAIVEKQLIKVEHFARPKRYPSAAAGELIRPPFKEPWIPLLVDENDAFTLGTFSLELVCSEMFPHASSANFVGIIEEAKELADRYGMGKGGETIFSHISRDIYEFARWTAFRNAAKVDGDTDGALVRGEKHQRTLIVLPAMTTRSADYHIFGQNQYLAAGLVTAFCNAVLPHASCGQSGFIGLDGWKRTEGIKTPYGSKAPGIFQLGDSHSGPLGETESAMVIADLDLLRTTDQRPRPHYQHRSLRLVAHLPILFATEKGGHAGPGSYPNKQRQPRTRTVEGKALTFGEARIKVAKALELESVWRSKVNVGSPDEDLPPDYQAAIAETLAALRVLEDFADDPSWLRKRTDSFKTELYDMPPMNPLPALVDWLYVDDRWLPEKYAAEVVLDGDDPLNSDKSLLNVPRSMQDEPPRTID